MKSLNSFYEEILSKERELFEKSSLEEKVVYCMLNNFNIDFCKIDERDIENCQLCKLVAFKTFNKKPKEDFKIIKLRINQLDLNKLMHVLVYLLYKSDLENIKFSPYEYLIIKSRFPNVQINLNDEEDFVEKEYLNLLSKKIIDNGDISFELLIKVFNEI